MQKTPTDPSGAPRRISADEQARLAECSVEPIRTPGAVQPYGVVVVADAGSFKILHVSANSFAHFGLDSEWLLGQTLADVFGEEQFEQFQDVLDKPATIANPAVITIAGARFDAIVHRFENLVVIDLEPTLGDVEFQSTASLYAAIHSLSRIQTAAELWAGTANAVRRITLFDQVMIYHFHPDDHGEIVAEDLADGMQPYLGLHYPASDIPAQARELYLQKLSRVIASSEDAPSDLVSAAGPDAVMLVDLSVSELRGVSPHHLQFMRNMGQASTLSLSLVHDNRLIGMITCAHRTPRRVPFAVRQGLEILANQVALQLNSIESIQLLTRRAENRLIRTALTSELTDETDIVESLLAGALTILEFIPADAAVIRLGGLVTAKGPAPSVSELGELMDAVLSGALTSPFVTDALPLDHPELAALVPGVAGLLVVPIGGDGDYVAWFREELVRTVHWLGDQSPDNRQSPLSPRNSFSAWNQDVTGTSASWDGLEADAAEFGHDLESALLRRAESRLAQVALHDPLTGLPNRRLLMDRLDHALAKYARGEDVALLFIDLDGFKAINDTLGHEAGDAVLLRTARRLLATARVQDTVARIGGDEFVILCEDTTFEQAELLAERILVAIRTPAHAGFVADAPVTASVGITTADLSFDAADLLRQADAAMYRAKESGRDQVSR